MKSRAEYRRKFAAEYLPRIAEAAKLEGFVPEEQGDTHWSWVRAQSDTARAVTHIREMKGRHTADGVDLTTSGTIYLDDVEAQLRRSGDRHPDAATLIAPLRAWGATFTHDGRYPLRWSASPETRVDALIRDLRSFSSFTRGVTSVLDLSPRRLARSRIRKHVSASLAPCYCSPDVESVIRDLTRDDIDEES